MSTRICDLCDGKGEVADPVELARQYKRQAREAQDALYHLKMDVALYLATEQGHLPEPPLRGAPRPSACPETWHKHLVDATRDLPRLT
jgi:hypothetical protein